jgi:RNA polymerase sigma-70 factor (TIGR02943 family)
MSDFAERVAAQRPILLRTAHQLLRNKAWAEDAVSETLVAALEKPSAFAGGAQLRTWLVAILKHKIVDQIRHHTRECQVDAGGEPAGDVESSDAPLASAFAAAAAGIDPQERLSRLQFITELDQCLQTLPQQQERAFILRNCLEKDTGEICDELGVTANNLYVILHRANRRLRASFQEANHGFR